MRYEWIDEYLLSKRSVTKELQKDWNRMCYKIGNKMFAAVLLDYQNVPYYINLKLEPEEGAFLREQYTDIVPGYYSNKQHWNSVKPDGAVPDDLLKDMLDKSYQLVLSGFSKKRQREILGLSCCGTDCNSCACYGSLCQGCNAVGGKVFHSPKGCPIYSCSVNKNKFASCAACDKLPCDIWRSTRDPKYSDEEFEASIQERVRNLLTI